MLGKKEKPKPKTKEDVTKKLLGASKAGDPHKDLKRKNVYSVTDKR